MHFTGSTPQVPLASYSAGTGQQCNSIGCVHCNNVYVEVRTRTADHKVVHLT